MQVDRRPEAVLIDILEKSGQEVGLGVKKSPAGQVGGQDGLDGFVRKEVNRELVNRPQAGEQVNRQNQAKAPVFRLLKEGFEAGKELHAARNLRQ